MAAGLAGRIVSERALKGVVEGSAQRRYNLVNRALRAGELRRLRRGLYMLAPMISGVRPHSFVVAQALRSGSYVSFESSLEWNGCIPEAVRQVRSVTPGRRQALFKVPEYGEFRFVPMAVEAGSLLAGVERHKLDAGIGFVACPLRALLDLCCQRKIGAEAIRDFLASLRLDPDWLESLTADDVRRYEEVYRFGRMRNLVNALAEGISE